METPVLYFYAPREQTVSVQVRFAKGVITEWYPRASRIEPGKDIFNGIPYQNDYMLSQKNTPDGGIAWDSVTLAPNLRPDFPNDNRASHYYAARQTTSTPLRVRTSAGEQQEKFLFYRGVAAFPVPIAANVSDQSSVRVENRTDELSSVLLFERCGAKMGYRIAGPISGNATALSIESPELTGTMDSLAQDLEGILISQGLYQNEAHAMVETWRDSWFEEGSRLLYIVPEKFVNSVLSLKITPAPEQTVRVFVGRLELMTPATQHAVEQAFVTLDTATLQKYGRFLEPILQIMIQQSEAAGDASKASRLREDLNTFYNQLFSNHAKIESLCERDQGGAKKTNSAAAIMDGAN
jgi:hypothetical protein